MERQPRIMSLFVSLERDCCRADVPWCGRVSPPDEKTGTSIGMGSGMVFVEDWGSGARIFPESEGGSRDG